MATRWLVITGMVIGAVACLGLTQGPSSRPATQTSPSTGIAKVASLTPEQMSNDIDFLVKTILDCHPNPYAYVTKAELDAAIEQARQKCQTAPMSIDRFYEQAAWLAARIRNGHTRLWPPDGWVVRCGGKVFPVRFRFDGRDVILTGGRIDKQYLGRPVLKIAGEDAAAVIRRYVSLCPQEGRDFDPNGIRNLDLLWFCLAQDYGQGELAMELQTADGELTQVTVQAVGYNELTNPTTSTASSPATRPAGPVRYEYRTDPDVGILTVKEFGDDAIFKDSLTSAFSDLQHRQAGNLIIDLRACPGGNSELGHELLRYLADKPLTMYASGVTKFSPLYMQQRGGSLLAAGRTITSQGQARNPGENELRFKGRVLVLIDGTSNSTTMDVAAVIKYYHLGSLIGEETGDTMISYGDNLSYQLPNSRLKGSVACKRFDTIGATSENALRGVVPDHHVAPMQEDWAAGRDTVMDFATRLLTAASGDNPGEK